MEMWKESLGVVEMEGIFPFNGVGVLLAALYKGRWYILIFSKGYSGGLRLFSFTIALFGSRHLTWLWRILLSIGLS